MSMRSPTTRPVVVSGSDDATVRVWDLDARGLLYQPLEAHQGKVNAVAVGKLHGRPVAVSGDLGVRSRTSAERGARPSSLRPPCARQRFGVAAIPPACRGARDLLRPRPAHDR